MKYSISLILPILFGVSAWGQTLSIYRSGASVEVTTEKIIGIIESNDLIFFEVLEHDKIAAKRGVELSEMREILFEDADMTTNLIKCQPTTALDLPLKILVWEENGDVYIGFIDPKFMKKRFMLSDCGSIVDDMGNVLVRVVVDALKVIQVQD